MLDNAAIFGSLHLTNQHQVSPLVIICDICRTRLRNAATSNQKRAYSLLYRIVAVEMVQTSPTPALLVSLSLTSSGCLRTNDRYFTSIEPGMVCQTIGDRTVHGIFALHLSQQHGSSDLW